MILSISLKKLCSGFGRADIGYVNYEIIEHFITVTFPYNAKFLLPQERNVVLLMYSQGGLDITNVYSYCKSVKFMWIKKQ
jgi:hypothetical protein